ncbi:esterase, partial [Prevotella copri]|nr:esterase [Segatella copri]
MNPYIKQFPDLMAGKKIMYVHGFLSSAQSGTVKMLQELMPNATLLAEDIPVHPEEAIEMLQKFEMGNTMSSMTGKQEFQNPRKDGVNELMVTKGLIKEYRDFTERCFQDITPEEQQRVYGLFGDADPLVHTFDLFHEHYPLAIPFHGEHRLIDKVAFHYLCPVIRWIDDKQNGKERPIVYIDFDALHDSYMKA